jgi:hypothetical protein
MGWHSCGKWCLASWGQVWWCLVLLNLPHTTAIFLVLYSKLLHRDTSVLANDTAGLQFCYLFNISAQWRTPEHLSHFTGVQSSFKWKNHSQPCVQLMGSQKAALIISFDSHFICFYVEVDTHMFHCLGHHKYDMRHKHYSLLWWMQWGLPDRRHAETHTNMLKKSPVAVWYQGITHMNSVWTLFIRPCTLIISCSFTDIMFGLRFRLQPHGSNDSDIYTTVETVFLLHWY